MNVAVFITQGTACHTQWRHATPLQMLKRRSRNVLYKHNQREMKSGRKGHLRKLQMEEKQKNKGKKLEQAKPSGIKWLFRGWSPWTSGLACEGVVQHGRIV